MRWLNWLCLTLISSTALAADGKPISFLDAESAGPDFAVQGEYSGKFGDGDYGVQVIALGNGSFDGVVYPGGLPGAGWTKDGKVKLNGKTAGDSTTLTGQNYVATIKGSSLQLSEGGKTGTLKKVLRESPTLGAKPPANAIVLFDGKQVDHWEPGKLEAGGLMGVGTRTKEKFGSFTLHLEFRTPFMPLERGQARGNSGMYLQDQYECQILDSFGLDGADNECGGIYSNAKPAVNMCLPPLSWQTYDVEFITAKFDDAGKVVEPARTTIKHNGVVVHDNVSLKTTPGGGQNNAKPGPLFLQDHGGHDPVRFRNIWIIAK